MGRFPLLRLVQVGICTDQLRKVFVFLPRCIDCPEWWKYRSPGFAGTESSPDRDRGCRTREEESQRLSERLGGNNPYPSLRLEIEALEGRDRTGESDLPGKGLHRSVGRHHISHLQKQKIGQIFLVLKPEYVKQEWFFRKFCISLSNGMVICVLPKVGVV